MTGRIEVSDETEQKIEDAIDAALDRRMAELDRRYVAREQRRDTGGIQTEVSDPTEYRVQRTGNMAIITLLDDIVAKPQRKDEDQTYTATCYKLKLIWRDGIEDPRKYRQMLAFAKKLSNPQTVAEKRQARDVLL